ncbi:MAG: MltA domain-containing protein [Desulfotignum sp.]|nr:MltA domain-containing protein [Desulfotignum sp.]MCF8112909.1 MltA domain-containing protein [Desulfotignum sp.]MCF8126359.1 MltA domain-containing protein [Desulfotignum sp.]
MAGTALLWLAGCGIFEDKPPGEIKEHALKILAKKEFPHFMDSMDFSGFHQALAQSLAYYRRVPGSRMVAFGPDQYTATHMIRSIETLQAFVDTGPSVKDLNRFIQERFHVYESTANENGQVLFTGYFEPTYSGSLFSDERFQYPLYPVPSDLVEIDLALFSDRYKDHDRLKGRVDKNRVVPYFSRQAINTMPDFYLRAPPVAWLENRVDRFFLEIQGSGRIQTPENEIIRIQYAGVNGNRYRSIGRYLIDNQEIAKENMSMQAIRQWLENNPHRMDEVLHHNESFVFFKIGTGGPLGNIGVTLTPLRSMATDYRIFPKGAPGFIETRLPDPSNPPGLVQTLAKKVQSGPDSAVDPEQWPRVSLFVMNQDTGGAIRGPARADLFCGSDDYARFAAGHMNVRGKIYFLVIR